MSDIRRYLDMVGVSSRFMAKVTTHTFAGFDAVLIPANIRRFYLKFFIQSGSAITIWPYIDGRFIVDGPTVDTAKFEWKWKDAPSITTGAFRAIEVAGLAGTLHVFEEIYQDG